MRKATNWGCSSWDSLQLPGIASGRPRSYLFQGHVLLSLNSNSVIISLTGCQWLSSSTRTLPHFPALPYKQQITQTTSSSSHPLSMCLFRIKKQQQTGQTSSRNGLATGGPSYLLGLKSLSGPWFHQPGSAFLVSSCSAIEITALL